MEKMYQDYKDVVEFRMVYITEAHAVDSNRPVQYAKDKDIKQHTNFGERCTTAEMLIKDKSLTIPTLIDGMDNAANKAYSAHPDRIFLIRKDGRLAVAADRGPFGFAPALDRAADWLKVFKESGDEPALPDGALEAAEKRALEAEKKKEGGEKSSGKKTRQGG